MNPVVRVFAERAAARRASLLSLTDVIPAEFWQRRSPGDEWDAHHHLAHALSADSVVAKLLVAFLEHGTQETGLDELLGDREAALTASLDLEPATLVASGQAARNSLLAQLERVAPPNLEGEFLRVATPSPWTPSASLTLYAYLEQWALHDAEHEFAIRAAITTPPDLSAAAHIRRLR